MFRLVVLCLYMHQVRFQIRKPLCGLNQICDMTENILHILVCLIRHIGKSPECRYICENMVVIDHSGIHFIGFSADNISRSIHYIGGKSQTGGIVIGRTHRYISYRYVLPAEDQRGKYLIQRTIPSGRNYDLIFLFRLHQKPDGISLCLGRIDFHHIACLCKQIDHARERRKKAAFSGLWIID